MKLTFKYGMRTVRSYKGITLYARSLNQNPIYFVSWFGIVIHMGSRKHCNRMFRYYCPDYRNAPKTLTAGM